MKVQFSSPEGPTNKCDITVLCLPACRFDSIYQRPQAMARAFAHLGHPCVYASQCPIHRFYKGRTHHEPGLNEVNVRTLPTRLVACSRIARRTNRRMIVRQLLQYLNGQPVIVVSSPLWAEVIEQLQYDGLIVYDCYDDWGMLEEDHSLDLDGLERRLLPHVDFATVTTLQLGEKLRGVRSDLDVLESPNAVDFEKFRNAEMQGKRIRKRYGIQGPVMGFLGAIYKWVDEELLYHLAVALPESTLLMCGPVDGFDSSRLEKLPNVVFTGMVPYDEVPAHIDAFDVALVPFKIIERMQTVNSNKFYQYMALGKPIVSVNIPSVHLLGGLADIAENRREFIALVKQGLVQRRDSNELETERQRRISYASGNSWRARAKAVWDRAKGLRL